MTTKDIDPLPFTPPDPNDRFWSKVAIRGPDECWEWLGTKNKGYGLFRVGQVKDIASRVAWERAHKRGLWGKMACHTCDNPGCCNPAHIYAGTAATNSRDASERGRLRAGRGAGETHTSAKLTWAKVAEIRKAFDTGASNYAISRSFGVTPATIGKIRDGVTWKQTEAKT